MTSESEPGGMLRWAIPEFRLPTVVVEHEIGLLRRMGVTFRMETVVGSDLERNAVKESHQAVIVATGCPRHLRLENSDESLAAIVHGLPFLKSVRSGQRPAVGRQVVVIGGGNVAVDAAQTALRLGAEQVTMVCSGSSASEVPCPSGCNGPGPSRRHPTGVFLGIRRILISGRETKRQLSFSAVCRCLTIRTAFVRNSMPANSIKLIVIWPLWPLVRLRISRRLTKWDWPLRLQPGLIHSRCRLPIRWCSWPEMC